ncbi:hypothetical protein [Virgibacillus ihumii]|uniref:hypothetical protein n=1 Tax=Virgibacillus ihumii TaxID=2686091 RepID=UPI00157DF29D|nr:hypothetical protein [Virgibacillus ihumii]
MNNFEKNYWSFYLDFLDDFKGLTYDGYSIPYFCVCFSIIHSAPAVWKNLYNEKLIRQSKNQVNDKKQVQAKLYKYIHGHRKKPLDKNKHGKVVLHTDSHLRFPKEALNNYFNPSKTMLLSNAKINTQQNKNHPVKKKKKKASVRLKNTISVKGKSFKEKQQMKAKKTKRPQNIPIDYLYNYSTNTEKAVKKVQNKAKIMFRSYPKHPLYSNKHFQRNFLTQIHQIVDHIERVKNFLKKVPVSCIVISHGHSINRVLAIVAAENGIPTICMQHGVINSQLGYFPQVATIDAVYGKFERDWFIKNGAHKNAVKIIGHPKFDQIFKGPIKSRSVFNKKLGLDTNKKTLMLAVRENYDLEKWRRLIKYIANRCDVNILIKDYPGRRNSPLLKEFPFVHSTKDLHLYDVLPNVDAVASYPSTVGLEAMLADKPAFILCEQISGKKDIKKWLEDFYSNRSLIGDPGYSGYYNGLNELVQSDPIKLGKLIINYLSDNNWIGYAKKTRDNFLSNAYPDFEMSGKRLNRLINRLTS